MAFLPKLTEFLADMNKPYIDPLKELRDEPRNEIIIEDCENCLSVFVA